MKLFFLLFAFVFVVGCEKTDEGGPAANGPTSGVFEARAEPLNKLHHYQVAIQWNSLTRLGTHLQRQRVGVSLENLTRFEAPMGRFFDKEVTEGETYSYSIEGADPKHFPPVTVTVPRDFHSDEIKDSTLTELTLEGYGRVVINRIERAIPIFITAKTLIAEGSALINTSPISIPKRADGADAHPITVGARDMTGVLFLFADGETGSPEQKNEAGEVIRPAGKGGKSGRIQARVINRGNYHLYASLRDASGGTFLPNDLTVSESVHISIDTEKANFFPPWFLPLGWDGVYSVGVDQLYLSPDFQIYHLANEPAGMKAIHQGSARHPKRALFGYRGRGTEFPPERTWGRFISEQDYSQARVIKAQETSGEMNRFHSFSSEIGELRSKLAKINTPEGERRGPYVRISVVLDNSAPLVMESCAPFAHVKALSENAAVVENYLRTKKLTGIYFFISPQQEVFLSPANLTIHGVPKMSPEELIESIKNDRIPVGAPK